jgi:hypothetical protein
MSVVVSTIQSRTTAQDRTKWILLIIQNSHTLIHRIYRSHRHDYHQVRQVRHIFCAPTHSIQSTANDFPLPKRIVFCLCRSFSFHEQFHFTFFFLIGRLLLRLPVLTLFGRGWFVSSPAHS